MEIKDLTQDTIEKISFPDEDEIESEIDRVFLSLFALENYFLDIGMDPNDVFDSMAYACVQRFCINSEDLEFARQRILGFLEEGLEMSMEEKKKLDETSHIHQADFFSIFLETDGKTTFQ